MKFSIGKREYKIEHTDTSINLYEIKTNQSKESKNFGQKTEQILGFYQGYDMLYRQLVKNNLSVNDSKIKSFEDIIKHIQEVDEVLKSLLTIKK